MTEWFVAGGILAILVLVAIAAAAWRVGRARGISFMHKDGTKSGGRKAGTPNKATRELKSFLEAILVLVAIAAAAWRVGYLVGYRAAVNEVLSAHVGRPRVDGPSRGVY